MTMIMSEVEHHPIFTYAPECEWENQSTKSEDCELAAKWSMRLSCCGELWLMCDMHKNKVLDIHKRMGKPMHDENDGGCGHEIKNIIVEAL